MLYAVQRPGHLKPRIRLRSRQMRLLHTKRDQTRVSHLCHRQQNATDVRYRCERSIYETLQGFYLRSLPKTHARKSHHTRASAVDGCEGQRQKSHDRRRRPSIVGFLSLGQSPPFQINALSIGVTAETCERRPESLTTPKTATIIAPESSLSYLHFLRILKTISKHKRKNASHGARNRNPSIKVPSRSSKPQYVSVTVFQNASTASSLES